MDELVSWEPSISTIEPKGFVEPDQVISMVVGVEEVDSTRTLEDQSPATRLRTMGQIRATVHSHMMHKLGVPVAAAPEERMYSVLWAAWPQQLTYTMRPSRPRPMMAWILGGNATGRRRVEVGHSGRWQEVPTDSG